MRRPVMVHDASGRLVPIVERETGDEQRHIAQMPCPMTTEDLRAVETRYQRAFRRADDARAERNRLVRHAIAEGWTHAQIAEATGLTRSRIGQIALQK